MGLARVCVAVAALVASASCADDGGSQPAADVPVPSSTHASTDLALVAEAFIDFAREPSNTTLPRFDAELTLILGPERSAELAIADPSDPGAWFIDFAPSAFRGYIGTESPLTAIADVTEVDVQPGVRSRACATAALPLAADLIHFDYVSIQPVDIESCLEWFAVDLLVNSHGEIQVVLLDAYEP